MTFYEIIVNALILNPVEANRICIRLLMRNSIRENVLRHTGMYWCAHEVIAL